MSGHIDWQADALCVDAPTELFFPDVQPGSNPHRSVGPVAKHWCQLCPVREQCGAFADQHRLVGLWGGAWRTVSIRSTYTRLPLIAAAGPKTTEGHAERAATVRTLTAQGLCAREIATRIGVSERTIVRLRGRPVPCEPHARSVSKSEGAA